MKRLAKIIPCISIRDSDPPNSDPEDPRPNPTCNNPEPDLHPPPDQLVSDIQRKSPESPKLSHDSGADAQENAQGAALSSSYDLISAAERNTLEIGTLGLQPSLKETGWNAVKRVLSIIHQASPAFPPLQSAVGGVVAIMNDVEVSTMWESRTSTTNISIYLAGQQCSGWFPRHRSKDRGLHGYHR